MGDLRVELHSVKFPRGIAHGCRGAARSMSQVYKSRRQSAYVIRVAHPYCVHLGDAGKKSFGCTAGMIYSKFSLPILGRDPRALHCAAGHPA